MTGLLAGGILDDDRQFKSARLGKAGEHSRIDVGPLDSYYHDLLQRHEPAFAAQVRTVARTAPMPIPPLVATAPLSSQDLQRLRAALADVAAADDLREVRERLLLKGFAAVDPAVYDALAAIARRPVPAFEEL